MLCSGSWGGLTHPDRNAADLVHDREAVLVREIVADVDRQTIGEWRSLHERADGGPLGASGGPDLEHALPCLYREAAASLLARQTHCGTHLPTQMRGAAEVHGETVALVFKQQAFVLPRELL